MTKKESQVPVVDVDQVFPVLTSTAATAAGRTTTDFDQGPVVSSVLRDVLGWRPRVQDSTAFLAALTASFRLRQVEGHVEISYVPRGFAMQADLGSVSGGQASLFLRARSALTQMTDLLDGLTPLRTDADPDDCAAYRLLVRHGIARLVDELGTPGGPRQPVVDSGFDVLAGRRPDRGDTAAGDLVTADTVAGQLGALREQFGLQDQFVNTVDEEKMRTSFWTLVDLVLDLRRSWEDQKGRLASQAGIGFLGTDLVIISRLLAAAAEQVDELEAILDSVLVGASERQTLTLAANSGLTLDGLVKWLRQFLTEDGPMYIRDSGRDGMRTAFAPTAGQLLDQVRNNVAYRLDAKPAQIAVSVDVRSRDDKETTDGRLVAEVEGAPMHWLPTGSRQKFPSGMYSSRARIAVAGLARLLHDLFVTASRIGRYPGVVLFDVEFQELSDVGYAQQPGDEQDGDQHDGDPQDGDHQPTDPNVYVRITLRGANLRPNHVPVLLTETTPHTIRTDDSPEGSRSRRAFRGFKYPLKDSVTANADSVSGIFRVDAADLHDDAFLTGMPAPNWRVVLPAQVVPVTIADRGTGEIITAPLTRTWPRLTRVPSNPAEVRTPIDWSDQPEEDGFFGTSREMSFSTAIQNGWSR